MDDRLRSELLAEHKALRAEIVKRIELRQQILTFTLVIAGTLVTLGLQANVTFFVLLVYPSLAMWLALAWLQSDVRVHEIGQYIREKIEPELPGINWETYIRDQYAGQTGRRAESYAKGIFLGTQCLALLLAIAQSIFPTLKPQLPQLNVWAQVLILSVVGALPILYTRRLLSLRGRMLDENEEKHRIHKADRDNKVAHER